MPGYQPHKMIEVYVDGIKLSRTAPTKPNSLRCKLGFHNHINFELTEEQAKPYVEYSLLRGTQFPSYCERCDEIHPGRRIPPKPKTESSRFSPPPVKPAKGESISYVKPRQTRAEEVLGLEINKLIDLQKVISSGDLEAIRFYVGDIKALRSMHDHPMNFMRNREILTDEEREFMQTLQEGEGEVFTFVKQTEPHDLGRWWDDEHQRIMADRSAVVAYFVSLIDDKPDHPIVKHVVHKAAGNGVTLQSKKFKKMADKKHKAPEPPERPSGIRNVKDGVDK